MDQMTYDQVLASIDREKAAKFVTETVIYLGGRLDWGSDEFEGVTQGLRAALAGSNLPDHGDVRDGVLKFWGTLALELGYETDYAPDEEDEEDDEDDEIYVTVNPRTREAVTHYPDGRVTSQPVHPEFAKWMGWDS